MDLSRFRGTNRLVLIFASSNSDENAERQRDLLEGHESGIANRDLLVLHLLEDVPGGPAGESITPQQAAAARRDFGLEDGRFAAVLVGRDGGAKFRSGEPVSATDLFARIDAMPMRRREMRVHNRA